MPSLSLEKLFLSDGSVVAYQVTHPNNGDSKHDVEPIILFHESLGCIKSWGDFPVELSEATGRIVVSYDRPGFGQSSTRRTTLSPNFIDEEIRETLPQLLEHLAINKFVAIGHSVGGSMAYTAAGQLPEKCIAVVSLAAIAFVHSQTIAGIKQAEALYFSEEKFSRLQHFHGEKAQWVLRAWIDTWLSDEFSNWSLGKVLGDVKCPSLAILGAEDNFVGIAQLQYLSKKTVGPCKTLTLSGVGHVPHKQAGFQVLRAIELFLKQELSPIDT